MVTHQHRILMIMESMKFEYEVVDIAGPGMDDAKDFMRANSKKKENERHALPPQIFNGEKYCGVSFSSSPTIILTEKCLFILTEK